MGRSVLSVVTAIVVWGTLWVFAGTSLARAMPTKFDQSGITNDPILLVALIAMSSALSVFAGWLCATIARRSIMKHVLALAVIQLAIGVFVQSSVWDQMPLWYHLIFLAMVVPMHLAGGRIRAGQVDGNVIPATA